MEEDKVQEYLVKHKISSLFEDLMSRVVKELPADPIEYLIGKLQALQKRKGSSSIPTAKTSRGRIQVTGTSITSKSPGASTKAPVSDRLSKSTSGLRPVKPKSVTSLSSSPSKTTPTKTTPKGATPTRTSVRPASGRTPTTKTPITKTPVKGTIASKSLASSRPTTAPVGSKTGTTSIPRVKNAQTSSRPSSGTKPSSVPAKASTNNITSSNEKKKRTGEPKPAEIDEFFGEAKKSSEKHHFVGSKEEEESESDDVDTRDDEGSGDDDDDGEKVTVRTLGKPTQKQQQPITIEDIRERRKQLSKQHGKKARHADLQSLILTEASHQSNANTPLSLGYHEDTESDEEEGGAELLEAADMLKDEGVEVTESKYTMITRSHDMEVDKTFICAWCAKELGRGEQSVLHPDIESASQVGSHVSFPQWESGGSSMAEPLPSHRMSEGDEETVSEVTLQSHDTWGGLAPPVPAQLQLSDEESEVQLPPPPPLEGHAWLPDAPPQRDAYGWGQAN